MASTTKQGSGFQPTSASNLSARACLLLSAALVIGGPAIAEPVLPQGGTVASGAVDIAPVTGSTLTLNQSSNSAVVNWNSFSIGQGGHVNIQQPNANASMLNRVTGNTTSEIHGRLTANGNVHLVNPNGIFIGRTGTVDAGGFVASTLDIDDGDFAAGRLRYQGQGNSATVSNAGRVTIGRGGYAALLGGKVRNSGTVLVPFGRIGFGAGEWVTLDVSGDQFLEVAVPSNSDDDEFLIENSGTASAEGGLIEMRAATARNAARNAINLSGVAEATSVSVRGGAIVLGGGNGGRVKVTGRVSTRKAPRPTVVMQESLRPRVRGGTVEITGRNIDLAGATIDASGDDGGLIRIGGDFAGEGPLQRADFLTADDESWILADALAAGEGGRIVLWSELQTDAAANLSARGGDLGGNGGFIEVSSRQTLNYSGLADLRAPDGDWGKLWLDPTDFTVNPGAGANNEDVVEAALEMANLTLDTAPENSEAGVITINADLDWTAATTLELIANSDFAFGDGNTVAVNGAITAPAGTLDITSGQTVFPSTVDGISLSGAITVDTLVLDAGTGSAISATGAINVGTFELDGGEWSQISAALPAFSATDGFNLDGGTFVRALAGDGATIPYELADVYGLQGIATLTTSNFIVANDIDASVTAGWTRFSRSGFDPIFGFSGNLDGNDLTISDLLAENNNGEGFSNAGLFDSIDSTGSVSDLTLANFSITGSNAGTLAAVNNGTVSNVVASGAVAGLGGDVGGLVGDNSGTLQNSSTSATVNALADGFFGNAVAGGAVGSNIGTIDTVSASGSVTLDGVDFFGDASLRGGGFVGLNSGSITGSTASGNTSVGYTEIFANEVTVTINAGGFVGESTAGTIDNSVASGTTTVNFDGEVDAFSFSVGGFAGLLTGGTNNLNRAEGNVTVNENSSVEVITPASAGGFVGRNFATITAGRAIGVTTSVTINSGVTGFQPIATGGFAGTNFGDIQDSTADGSVTTTLLGPSSVELFSGGFVGSNSDASIQRSNATGAVTVSNAGATLVGAGGFAGLEVSFLGSTILDSYAQGNVTVGSTNGGSTTVEAAGFVGRLELDGVVERSYSSGSVTTTGDATVFTGGFAANNVDGSAVGTTNFWDTVTSGQAFSAFGTGITTAQFQDTETFISLGSAQGWNFATVWAPGDTGFYPVNYTTTSVIMGTPVDIADIQYGLTPTATTTGTVNGGPELFVFDEAGDTLDTSTLFDSLDFAAETVGTQNFGLSTASLNSDDGVSYRVVDRIASANVTPAPLTITADDRTKTYGDTVTFGGTEFGVSGTLFFTDTVTSVTLTSTGADVMATVDDGPYAITLSAAVGSGLTNYDITFADGSLVVDPAPLTITPNDQTKVYGNTFTFAGTEFTTAGLLFTDTVDSITLASAGAAAEATVVDGPYTITGSDAVGSGLTNYDITFGTGTMTVTQASASITADDRSKVYGTGVTFLGTEFTVAGLLFEDSVDSVTLTSAGADVTANVADGPFAITPSDPVGTGIGNYTFTFVDGALAVTPAPLTITADDQTKVYGNTFTFAGTEFATAGLLNSDSIDTITLTSAGAVDTATVAGGPYAITGSDAVGTGVTNYDITFVDGSMAVTPAALTITPNDQVKQDGTELIFDGTEFTADGLLFEDTVTNVNLASDGAPADASIDESPFDITASEADGTGLGNYDITFGTGSLVIQAGEEEVIPIPPNFAGFPLPEPADTLPTSFDPGASTESEVGSVTTQARGVTAVSQAEETLAVVEDIAESLNIRANSCEQSGGNVGRYLACLADALEQFSDELDAIAADLPPGMQNVARIVQDARVQIDAARSRAQQRLATATTPAERQAIRRDALNESAAALATASSEIRKAISLVRAEDPELANVQRATVTRVADAVDSVGISLSRATEL